MITILVGILTFIIAIFGFGILVFFHELGHFIVAKLFRIKVEKFSVGMGPAIFGFQKNETYFQISVIPFGGFCKFKEEETMEDLPAHISLKNYNELIAKQNNNKLVELFYKNYSKELPKRLTNEDYNKILGSFKNENDKNIFLNAYKKDSEYNFYYIDSDSEYKDTLFNIIKDIDSSTLFYSLKTNIKEKNKKDMYKALSKKIRMYKLREPGTFYGVPPLKRLLVAFSGPFMNYIIALIFLSLLAIFPHKEIKIPTRIIISEDYDPSYNKTSPAKKAGLQTNDIILSIDDINMDDFNQVMEYLLIPSIPDFLKSTFSNKKKPLEIKVKRGRKVLTKIVKPEWAPEALRYLIGITSYIEPVIENTDESTLNHELGLKNGDIIVGIDDDYENICTMKINYFMKYNFGKNNTSVLKVKRNDEIKEIKVAFNEINHKVSENKCYINFKSLEKSDVEGKNLLAAFTNGFKESNDFIKMTFVSFFYLIFKPKKNVGEQIGGPVIIGYFIGSSTIEGFKESPGEGIRTFLKIISIFSLALAFFNLLPIPALDGGHILFNLIEIISRKQPRLKIMNIINMIFFIFLMGFAIIVVFFDISKIINLNK